MAEKAHAMLFPINGEPARYFYAGSLPEGRQTLIARFLDGEILVVVFDANGELGQAIRHELPSPPVIPDCAYGREVDEAQFAEYLKEQFGFTPGQIRVREFRLPWGGLAVHRLPERYQKFLRNPDDPDLDMEERVTFQTRIEEWERAGLFVLEVEPCDYWLDQTGEVVAS
jgi:hypothetical protein